MALCPLRYQACRHDASIGACALSSVQATAAASRKAAILFTTFQPGWAETLCCTSSNAAASASCVLACYRVRLRELLLQRGEAQGAKLYEHEDAACRQCNLFHNNLIQHRYRARLQELLLERGEASGAELYQHEDKERLATANAQRNIVRTP